MTQEEKLLLLKDLCARLPYGAFVQFEVDGQKTIKPFNVDFFSTTWYHTEYIKPYLRPMSSMTEEEKAFYEYHKEGLCSAEWAYALIDWLNSHHFDYRGLIEKGLALEAPEDMYKTEYLSIRLQEEARNYQDEERIRVKQETMDRIEWLAEMERDRRNGGGTD